MKIDVREIERVRTKARSMAKLKDLQAYIDKSIAKNGKAERTLQMTSIKELLTNNKEK